MHQYKKVFAIYAFAQLTLFLLNPIITVKKWFHCIFIEYVTFLNFVFDWFTDKEVLYC